MFQRIVYSLANRQGLFTYVRTCKTRLDTTTKFMVVVTSLFNLVISSFPDNMFYHVWTWLLIYHDGSNNVVQVCSFIKPRTVCSNMHEQACQQPCSSWPAQPFSSLPMVPNNFNLIFGYRGHDVIATYRFQNKGPHPIESRWRWYYCQNLICILLIDDVIMMSLRVYGSHPRNNHS